MIEKNNINISKTGKNNVNKNKVFNFIS